MFPDLIPSLAGAAPDIRGRLLPNVPLSNLTWLRAGGPAQALFTPADEDDLAYFLSRCPVDVPVTVIGVGSNLLVRDGGVPGAVIRLARGFNETAQLSNTRIRAGAAVPDVRLAQAAASAGIAGLAFYRGIPGTVGGALRMNAGAHGGETKDILAEARALDRSGNVHVFDNAGMGFTYRRCGVPADYIFTQAIFEGTPGDPAEIAEAMQQVAEYREANQPIKSRTGGSTFKNPPGHSAWKLIDAAGCRGLRVGGAHMSEMHCNFLINDVGATAADIERLGELVRERVFAQSGIVLEWEIKRIGIPAADIQLAAAE
ncbi:MAG: UDP-N-acetylmuramate dehydrogenase [Rhodomicrobium sp.]|nr:UDP-N-acetylmuramate dehydrogenase [Rhodomicrobium sp.]